MFDDPPRPRNLIVYDGVCGLCNRFLRFVIARDPAGVFYFTPLQGELAQGILLRHGRQPEKLDTVYLISGYGTEQESLREKSSAVFTILRNLNQPWPVVALLRFFPLSLSDRAYALIVRDRYRFFGKYEECPLPPPDHRQRFIERSFGN